MFEILSSGVQLRVRKDEHPYDARSKTVPIRHICLPHSYEHAFIYLFLNKWMQTIYFVFQHYLANNPLPLQMDLG